MANEEALGPRKTMFVLVIVVGCFAVLWPRILSPLILGSPKDQLKPNQYDRDAAVKQERPVSRGGPGPHPAMRERGRAIPPGAPTPPSRGPIPMPAHMRPPPIPGMRPPLGAPGGPVAAPKSSMGFVMPIYTICIIVFFVYTLSKLLFKRTAAPYDQVSPDPQFRRRVFRDESRTSPDKLGHKERDARDVELEALRARLADTERAMQRIVGQLAARDADVQQDNSARSYTNGTILHNSGPVHIITSEYQDRVKEKSPEPEPKEPTPEPNEVTPVTKEVTPESKEATPESKEATTESKDATPESKEATPESKDATSKSKEATPEPKEQTPENLTSQSPEKEVLDSNHVDRNVLLKFSESDVNLENSANTLSQEFLNEARLDSSEHKERNESKTSELLEEALREESPEEQENASVRVLGMEVSAHAADGGAWPLAEPHTHTHAAHAHKPAHTSEQVSSIFLQTEIPQQSRVLIADFAEDRDNQPAPIDSPLVVSGKMTLSLIQDEPRDTPERDIESTLDDFTTASAMTQPITEPAEKQEELPDDEEEAVAEEVVHEAQELNEEVEVKKEVVHKKEAGNEEEDEEEVVQEDELNEEENKEEHLNDEESEEEIEEEFEVEEIEVEVTDSEEEEYEQDKLKVDPKKK